MIVCNLLKTKIDYYLSKTKSNVLLRRPSRFRIDEEEEEESFTL